MKTLDTHTIQSGSTFLFTGTNCGNKNAGGYSHILCPSLLSKSYKTHAALYLVAQLD